jgi:hypothetical protein
VPPGDWKDVTIRRADGDLDPWERRVGGLAVGALAR